MGANLALPGYCFNAVGFSPDGKSIAAGVESVAQIDFRAVLLDATNGAVTTQLRGGFTWLNDFAFIPERNAIAFTPTNYEERPLLLWELGKD